MDAGLARALREPVMGTEALAEHPLRTRVIARSGLASLNVDGRPQLLVDFDRALAIPAVAGVEEDMARALAADFHRLELEPLSAREFNDSMAGTQALALAPLLWKIALQVQDAGALLVPMRRDSRLTLRQWPDFRALAHRNDHFRLCCLLLKRPCTAAEAGELLELDLRTVRAFYNAAWLSGYADVSVAAARGATVPLTTGNPQPRRHAAAALVRMWRSVRRTVAGGA